MPLDTTFTAPVLSRPAFHGREAQLLRRIALAEACNLSARADVYRAMLDGSDKTDPHGFRGLKECMAAEEDGRNMSADTARWSREVRTIDVEA